jgi:hypothetical protein
MSASGCYYHFETMDKWIGNYFDFKNVEQFQFNILNQFNSINREASFQYLSTNDVNAKIGFMRVRLEALGKLAEYAGFNLQQVLDPRTGKIVHLHMWRPGDPAQELVNDPSLEGLTPDCFTPEEKEIIVRAEAILTGKRLELKNRVAESLH